jgi:hypothetical protein
MRFRLVASLSLTLMLAALPASAQGLGWASETLSPPSGATQAWLSGSSCSSTSFCVAVGEKGSAEASLGPAAYRWNGTTWSNLATPESVKEGDLLDASCTSSSFCAAVGIKGPFRNESTLAEHWNGLSWSVVTTTPTFGTLSSVSCPASSACTAVGYTEGETAEKTETVVIRWNGSSWSRQSTPNPGSQHNQLFGVSCTSSTHCTAVGTQYSGEGFKTLGMTWNGTSWSAQTTPNPTGALDAEARDVSCTSSTACTAVGFYYNGNGPLPFAMRWNGSTWSLQSVKLPGETNFGWLYGVSCTSGTFCMAVGAYEKIGQGTFLMAQKWNGTSWTAEKPPSPGASSNEMDSVSCTASNWCKGVGYYNNGEGEGTPLAEHFSG